MYAVTSPPCPPQNQFPLWDRGRIPLLLILIKNAATSSLTFQSPSSKELGVVAYSKLVTLKMALCISCS